MKTKELLKLLASKLKEKETINLPGGKMEPIPGSDAVEFKGKKHEQGGIKLDKLTEVEGGETMDKVVLQDGVPNDYFFSSHLKHNGKSFAKLHKDILKLGGIKAQEKIQNLARMQEHRAGRDVNIVLGDKVAYGSDAGKYMSNYVARNGGVRKFHKGGVSNHGENTPSTTVAHTHTSYDESQTDEEWANSQTLPRRVSMEDLRTFSEAELKKFLKEQGTWVPKRYETKYPTVTQGALDAKIKERQDAISYNERMIKEQQEYKLSEQDRDNTRINTPVFDLNGVQVQEEARTFDAVDIPYMNEDFTYDPTTSANLVLKNLQIREGTFKNNSNQPKTTTPTNTPTNTSGGGKKKTVTKDDGFSYSGFENKADGDRFRNWLNLNYPEAATKFDLDKKGSHTNKYIKTALEEYGKEYSTYLSNEDEYDGDTFNIEEDREGTAVMVNRFGSSEEEWAQLPLTDKNALFSDVLTDQEENDQADAEIIRQANINAQMAAFNQEFVDVKMKDGRVVRVPKGSEKKFKNKDNYAEATSLYTEALKAQDFSAGVNSGEYTDDEGNLYQKGTEGDWRVKYKGSPGDQYGEGATTSLDKEWTDLEPQHYPGEMNLTATADQSAEDEKGGRSLFRKTTDFVRGADIKGLLVDAAQFLPVAMAMKDEPGYLKTPNALPEIKLNRVKYNDARSKNSADFNALNMGIDNAGHDPSTFAKKMALYGRSQEADLAIDATETRENSKIDAAEAGQNTQIRSENLKNQLYVDEFNLASDSATFDRKLNAMSTAVQNIGLLRERALQYKGQGLLADAVGRDGINNRQTLRGDMLTKYTNRTINGTKFADMSEGDQSLFISNVTNNNLNVLDLFD
jgi:hypothetical protein|tara:strand:- start:3680 stop:6238 length:2559 start_codon:yes stop_codon:yes gene_type:complete